MYWIDIGFLFQTMPEQGINFVSVLLHAHGTARKIALKHIRGTEELPVISAVCVSI